MVRYPIATEKHVKIMLIFNFKYIILRLSIISSDADIF